MTSKAALFALLTMWGVGAGACLPSYAEEAMAESTSAMAPNAKPGFTDRVWSKVDDGGLPGVMKIFLSDGTLVQDSCWETHRLGQWTLTSDSALKWNEDGMDITAQIVSLADTELVLNVNGMGDEKYTAAAVPYLCPDMPKG